MESGIQLILYGHIIAGGAALVAGAISIFTQKGSYHHRSAGKVYFLSMTLVFITGVIVASFQFNRFLLLIAFLSYYSVFCGVRILHLKQLHRQQKPKWYDWLAGGINTLANLLFCALGITYLLNATNIGGAILSIGFGIGGLVLSYTNMIPFIQKPEKAHHWYTSHIGNMMGGYIATSTAFLSTIVTRYDLMNPYIAFALPSLVGIPLMLFWLQKIENSFAQQKKAS